METVLLPFLPAASFVLAASFWIFRRTLQRSRFARQESGKTDEPAGIETVKAWKPVLVMGGV